MRETELTNGEYYHVFNRGVDQRQIFQDELDYERFYESMFLFNDQKYFHHGDPYDKILRLSGHEIFNDERDPFVKIIAFTLMPNHYHVLFQQLVDGGISKFLQKLNKGYSRYFNLKYERNGTLFEGPFKAKHIENDSYAYHIIPYIHLNILDLSDHNWRDGNIKDWESALKYMDRYKWSSHQFYRGKNQVVPLVDVKSKKDWFKSVDDYLNNVSEWSKRNFVEDIENDLINNTQIPMIKKSQ